MLARTFGHAAQDAIVDALPPAERNKTTVQLTLNETRESVITVTAESTSVDRYILTFSIRQAVCAGTLTCSVSWEFSATRRRLEAGALAITITRRFPLAAIDSGAVVEIEAAVASVVAAHASDSGAAVESTVTTILQASAAVLTVATTDTSGVDNALTSDPDALAASVASQVGLAADGVFVGTDERAPPPPPPPPLPPPPTTPPSPPPRSPPPSLAASTADASPSSDGKVLSSTSEILIGAGGASLLLFVLVVAGWYFCCRPPRKSKDVRFRVSLGGAIEKRTTAPAPAVAAMAVIRYAIRRDQSPEPRPVAVRIGGRAMGRPVVPQLSALRESAKPGSPGTPEFVRRQHSFSEELSSRALARKSPDSSSAKYKREHSFGAGDLLRSTRIDPRCAQPQRLSGVRRAALAAVRGKKHQTEPTNETALAAGQSPEAQTEQPTASYQRSISFTAWQQSQATAVPAEQQREAMRLAAGSEKPPSSRLDFSRIEHDILRLQASAPAAAEKPSGRGSPPTRGATFAPTQPPHGVPPPGGRGSIGEQQEGVPAALQRARARKAKGLRKQLSWERRKSRPRLVPGVSESQPTPPAADGARASMVQLDVRSLDTIALDVDATTTPRPPPDTPPGTAASAIAEGTALPVGSAVVCVGMDAASGLSGRRGRLRQGATAEGDCDVQIEAAAHAPAGVPAARVSVPLTKLRTRLHYAASNGDVASVRAALAAGEDVAWVDAEKGRSALWSAAFFGEVRASRPLAASRCLLSHPRPARHRPNARACCSKRARRSTSAPPPASLRCGWRASAGTWRASSCWRGTARTSRTCWRPAARRCSPRRSTTTQTQSPRCWPPGRTRARHSAAGGRSTGRDSTISTRAWRCSTSAPTVASGTRSPEFFATLCRRVRRRRRRRTPQPPEPQPRQTFQTCRRRRQPARC